MVTENAACLYMIFAFICGTIFGVCICSIKRDIQEIANLLTKRESDGK